MQRRSVESKRKKGNVAETKFVQILENIDKGPKEQKTNYGKTFTRELEQTFIENKFNIENQSYSFHFALSHSVLHFN